MTTVRYGATTSTGAFPSLAAGARINGGQSFFAGGDGAALSTASQTLSVSRQSRLIEARHATVTLSADLGGYSSQTDEAFVTATFLSSAGARLGSLKVGPVTEAQRGGQSILLLRSGHALLPRHTHSITVVLTAVRSDGSYNDGYADNLALTIAARGRRRSAAEPSSVGR